MSNEKAPDHTKKYPGFGNFKGKPGKGKSSDAFQKAPKGSESRVGVRGGKR